MRLVQVAKALGMTGQQLRRELTEVNFGVKPTDREVPENLAKGIVRFLARKYNLSVDAESIGSVVVDDEEEKTAVAEKSPEAPVAEALPEQTPAPAAAGAKPRSTEHLHVLRKLSLEDVPKEAIAKHEATERLSKAEKEARLQEERAQQRSKRGQGTVQQEQIKKKEGPVLLPDQISVKEFAEKTGIQVPQIIQTLMKNGVLATITQAIDYETAAIVAGELGVEVLREQRQASAEALLSGDLEELLKDDPEQLQPRPPVVVVMGHVDHGKTSILDAIRQTDVAAKEAGGITQHIGAYQVEHGPEHKKITFLDTPGHEAFTAMRARGAQVGDIAILVVSAEEGVRPTTVEAINHAKEADTPIIVAINKMDKERADPDRVKGELAAQGLQPEEWGGSVPFVPCSAVTKQGIDDLLEHVLLVAELHALKANPNRPAVATVIESHLDVSHGALATVIVNTGTLRLGDTFVCGAVLGKVKAMMDAHGVRVQETCPSGAVRVSGFESVPNTGDVLQVVPATKARELVEAFQAKHEQEKKRSFADLVSRLTEGKVSQLKVVLKTDAQGSLEAIHTALGKLTVSDEAQGKQVTVKIIHGAVGSVTESDVHMAAVSDGIILSFYALVPPEVLRTAEQEGIEIRQYTVLYELLDEVTALLRGLIEPEEKETVLGHLEVRGVFLTKKSEQVIGGRVSDGLIKRMPFRLLRTGQVVGTGRITSLRHVDKDIKEAKEGTECGMRVEVTAPIQEGDVLEVFLREWKRKEG